MDVTEASFVTDVIERSREVPVVVDFWAAWCGPCRALTPILERLEREAAGSWVLAKVDVDANQRLAAAAGVQGIPAVRAFKDGRQVAEFTGALPEASVRQWLEQLGPGPGELAFAEAERAEAGGDLAAAEAAYRRALDEAPGHMGAKAALARLELAQRVDGASVDDLRARAEADPTDVEAVMTVADFDAARGDLEAAFARLIDLVRATTGDERERARRHLLSLLDTIPPEDARAIAARRSLSMALF